MLTGRRGFLAVCFRCAEGARDGVFALFSRSFFFIPFFRGWKPTERRGSRVKGARLWRVHRSAAQTLDSPPALRTLFSEKWEISPGAFFSTSSRPLRRGCSTATGLGGLFLYLL